MKAFYNIVLLFLFFAIALAMAPDPSPPMKTENPHLQQYELVDVTTTNQQLLTLTGQRFDLAKITDAQAAVLYRSGCKYIALASPQLPSLAEDTNSDNVLADNDTNAYEIVDDKADSSPPNTTQLRKSRNK